MRRSPCSPAVRRRAIQALVIGLMGAQAAMIARLAVLQSPNIDELAHIAAGMATWQYGLFDVYIVNPPLVRAVATLPVLAMPHESAWGDFEHAPQPRPEFVLGAQFVESHPDGWGCFLTAARLALLPFAVLGAACCYLWANDLFGRKAGLLALALWCFSPNILTWSSVVCTDGPAAGAGVAAGYAFWRWLKLQCWPRALLAGVALAAALLTKMTWLVLLGVWPIVFCIWTILSPGGRVHARVGRQFVAMLVLAVYLVNFAYGFDGAVVELGDFSFHSRLFAGGPADAGEGVARNRFAIGPLRWLRVPLPASYVRGIDLQRCDFETGSPSYLFGEWSDHGWWYYYLVGLALKVPLGTWGLGIVSAGMVAYDLRRHRALRRGGGALATIRRGSACDQIAVLASAIAVLALVSSQDGFSSHFRYVLPVLPLAFVWLSQVARHLGRERPILTASVLCLFVWSVGSSLAAFPHTMTYFNELAGGSARGHEFMLGSSFSWAQDQFYLKEWLEQHPEVDSPYVVLDRSVALERLGILSRGRSPKGAKRRGLSGDPGRDGSGPTPGWHVIDMPNIHARDGGYLYFLQLTPEAVIGSSIHVYRIDAADANRLRRGMGLSEISSGRECDDRFLRTLAMARRSREPLAVALFTADGDARLDWELHDVIAATPGFSCQRIDGEGVRNGGLNGFDVLVVPGGSARAQSAAFGALGKAEVRSFVSNGRGYVGVCAGAYLATSNHDWGLGLVNARAASGRRYVPRVGTVSASFRGSGKVGIEITAAGEPLFGRPTREFILDYTDGPVFFRANEADLQDYLTLACFRSEVRKYGFQKGTMVDTPAILGSRFGQGTVILFSAHPESAEETEALLIDAVRACRSRRLK